MTAPLNGMLERNLALFPGWQVGGQPQNSHIERRDFLGTIASVDRATLGETELDVLCWLTAKWWEQGAPADGITRFTWYSVSCDLWGAGREPGGREYRMVREAVDNLMGAVVTLSGYNPHATREPVLFADVHILRSVVGLQRVGRDAASDGALREDTVEIRLEDWLVAQLLGDSVALLDWQIQRELNGVAKRLWCYLAGRSPDFVPTAWPGEEALTIPLTPDVYAGWSLNADRERRNRARATAAAERIARTDPRYVRIVVEPDARKRGSYQLRAVRRAEVAQVALVAAPVVGQPRLAEALV